MRLVTYLPPGVPPGGTSWERRHEGRAGVVIDDGIVDLRSASGDRLPATMRELIEAGPAAWQLAREQADRPDVRPVADLSSVRLLAPLPDPASLRDFFAFEDHVRRGFEQRGEPIPAAWFELPVSYLSNHRSILGPGDEIPWPTFTQELDYEAELAMVVGVGGRRIQRADARSHIFGYTILNDVSARDLQRLEMSVRLGPSRSKGFANVLGPCIVTPDELGDITTSQVRAWIGDDRVTDTDASSMRWSFEEMIASMSEAEDVVAGDVYGSGTVPNGCGLEHGRWVQPGETISIEVEGIGRLTNPVGAQEPG